MSAARPIPPAPVRPFAVLDCPDLRSAVRTGVIAARVTSDIDMTTEAGYRRDLERLTTLPNVRWVLLHVGQERFVDVTGLNVLLAASRAARRRHRGLVVVNPPACLRRMVESLQLSRSIPLARTPWAAADPARPNGGG